MSRKKKHREHANHERWLVSYADFITLLFAFFVVLFASSQVDQRKVGRLARAIQAAFQDMGIFAGSDTRMPFDSDASLNQVVLEKAIQAASVAKEPAASNGKLGDGTSAQDLKKIERSLEHALAPEIARGIVKLEMTREGLVISLREVGFFDSGSATLRAAAEAPVLRLAKVLTPYPHAVRIEGHTDNVPIHTARFASNWELSTTRATEMTKLFIMKYGYAPARLSAAGYAEFHPVASNAHLEGRAKNRRVDIVVLAPNYEKAEGRLPRPNLGPDFIAQKESP